MASNGKTLTVEMPRKKDTLRKVVFEADDPSKVGAIYVDKAEIEALGNPKAVTVTITAA